MTRFAYLRAMYSFHRVTHGWIVSALLALRATFEPLPF